MRHAYDDKRLAGAYHSGNELPEDSLRAWAELIGSYVRRSSPTVLDVGAGTGMFSVAMARWLQTSMVIGVDPSMPMLTQAHQRNTFPGVHYIAGDAHALPTRAGQFDLALLSRVIHHMRDRRLCARELKRVLRPDGVVFIRTTFRERLDSIVYDYWPRACG